ncbi:MAG: hypothetical protein LBT46_06785 [Planctomycetaceae bacterium]|jgi:hypothetical protein|nr:hypothetical protein [Planctomycetaceae bacterium]
MDTEQYDKVKHRLPVQRRQCGNRQTLLQALQYVNENVRRYRLLRRTFMRYNGRGPQTMELLNMLNRIANRIPVEVDICTVLGFLAASLMLNWSYGWVAYPVVVILFAAAGWIIGICRTLYAIVSGRHYLRRGQTVLILCIICAFAPYFIMKIYCYVQACDMPVPPGLQRISVQTDVLGWDSGAGYCITFQGVDAQEVLRFLCETLNDDGWRETNVFMPST